MRTLCSSPTSSISDTETDSEAKVRYIDNPAGRQRRPEISRRDGYWQGNFTAMASPCEVLLASDDETLARGLIDAIADEAWRIEFKFSRYRDDNIIHAINTADGATVAVDEETARLLDFADTCWRISDGKFDITSGVLRRAWKFDGSDHVPDKSAIRALKPLIGWDKVKWQAPQLTLKAGMEIDLGGIGKEYAVDRCALLALEKTRAGCLVNFGGDIRATGPGPGARPWRVGIEAVREGEATPVLEISNGAIATSGDARRFVVRNGVRYGHILDPETGWSVAGAPRSVTVLEQTCTQAGLLSTMAMFQGVRAERFLKAQGVRFHVLR